MWLGGFYIKPLYLLVAIAIVIFLLVIFIIKKIIVVFITAIILCIAVYGGNLAIIKKQAVDIGKYLELGKDFATNSFSTIKTLINQEDLRLKDDTIQLKVRGKWYNYSEIKDNIYIQDDNVYINMENDRVLVQSPKLKKFIKEMINVKK